MDSFEEVWSQVCEYCKRSMSETPYKTWIEPTDAEYDIVNDRVNIIAGTSFKQSILIKKFGDLIREAFGQVLGFDIDISFIVKEEGQENSKTEAPAITDKNGEPADGVYDSFSDEQTLIIQDIIDEETDASEQEEKKERGGSNMSQFTFDNFIVGSSNEMAHAAAWNVAVSEPGSKYNPLIIYGNSGLGKTHLMLAIRNYYIKRNENISTLYTTSENFMNEYISCISTKDMAAFREKYRNVDALFIDDIQFIKSKMQTQEEFFHTFNELVNNGKQIVMTSDRPPKEIENLDERIRSRFESGLIADIQSPDIEMRTAIIIKKAEEFNINIQTEIVNFIAEKVRDNVRQIDGVVKKMSAMSILLAGKPYTISQVQNIIKDIVTDTRPVSAIIEDIIVSTADKFEVTKDDMISEKRDTPVKNARNEAMYIIREVTGLSLENIGSYFGGKKHSTVKHSIDVIEDRMKRDINYKNSLFTTINNYRRNS